MISIHRLDEAARPHYRILARVVAHLEYFCPLLSELSKARHADVLRASSRDGREERRRWRDRMCGVVNSLTISANRRSRCPDVDSTVRMIAHLNDFQPAGAKINAGKKGSAGALLTAGMRAS